MHGLRFLIIKIRVEKSVTNKIWLASYFHPRLNMKSLKEINYHCVTVLVSLSIFILLVISCKNKNTETLSVKKSIIAQLDTNQYTMIKWKDTLVNFGSVKEGDTVRLRFSFVNTGNKFLFINQVRPSCGCTIVDYPEQPIKPGREGSILALFTTNWNPGIQKKSIQVKANTKGNVYHTVIFTGIVLPNPERKYDK